jgi:hypothetical protein
MADDNNPQGGQANIEEALRKFLEKFQKPEDGALKLYGENFQLREKNRTLEGENADLKKKVPADGMFVINKDDNELLAAAKGLELKPEQITNLSTENAQLKRSKMLNKLVEAGYSLSTLETFDELEGKEVEEYLVKEETKDGKPVKSGLVKVGGKEVSLDELVKEKRPALSAILKSTPQAGGTKYVNQDAGGKPPVENSVVDDFIKKRDERNKAKPSPFARPRAATA